MNDPARQAFAGLERSCDEMGNALRTAPPAPGLTRMEARFDGNAFTPHRHDTYAIGVTMVGVQSFSYRGAVRHSLAGQILVLHPDELHDGGAGSDAGLVYRMLYLDPELVARVLDGRQAGLPFVREPVFRDEVFHAALMRALGPLDEAIDALALDEILADIADALLRHADGPAGDTTSIDRFAVERARAYLAAHLARPVGSGDLEAVTGLDRFALARQFRRAFGTSPHRYLLMRRLDDARRRIETGVPLAEAAFASGFADQSHLTRHFKRTYGMTPGRWATLISAGRRDRPHAAKLDQAALERDRRLST